MNREQLAHVLRAASGIADDPDILVIGSQALLTSYDEDELPLAATTSMDSARCAAVSTLSPPRWTPASRASCIPGSTRRNSNSPTHTGRASGVISDGSGQPPQKTRWPRTGAGNTPSLQGRGAWRRLGRWLRPAQ